MSAVNDIKRHDLLRLSDEGRAFAYKEALLRNAGVSGALLHELIIEEKAPAIVKRQSVKSNEFIETGFSSWRIIDGRRFRAESLTPACFIEEVITPFQLTGRILFKEEKTGAVLRIAEESGVIAGFFGSFALAAATGRAYVNETSDLDVVIQTGARESILDFCERITREPALKDIRLDIELDIGDGYFVKLEEMFSGQATILAKGLWDVRLIKMNDIYKSFT